MRCAACSHDNLPGARFCSACGLGLERVCPSCGHVNGAEAQFCSACGRRLLPRAAAVGSAIDDEDTLARHLDGERRQITVLFCDIVRSTELAARLDPEEWHAISAQYQRCGAETVERFGGHVAHFLGDGLVTYFGYPLIHDDGPERGVRAGIALLDALAVLNGRLEPQHGVRLAVRIGIHTGEVVIGAGGGKEAEVFGEAVHVAARVEQIAESDEVLVTAATCRLVPGLFVMEERGVHRLRGLPEPVALYRVLQPTGARGRLKAAGKHALTPFVGREAERALLHSRWERAQEGQGQVVLVSGEPGIGKSRLVQVFRDEIAGCPQAWVEWATSPYHEHTPFFPVIDLLQQSLVQQSGDSPEQQVSLLERALETTGLDPRESLPLVANLIGLTLPPERAAAAGSPGEQRQRLMATLVRWVLGTAAVQPMVLVVEDLMWADPSTIELLDVLGQQAATAPLLLIYTARPEFRCPWPARSHFTTMTLNRLSRQQVRQMIGGTVPELIEMLVTRSDGVPLFAEELTHLVQDAVRPSVDTEIPATLQDLLTARLDRLGPARRIAQIGAVIGREFSYTLLEAVAGSTVPDLSGALAHLTDAELLHARGLPPDATYVFKHALIRDAAYASLLKNRRRELHIAIAAALVDRFPETAEALPELVAHHYTEAADLERAWREWQRAGERAVVRSALLEAAGHFTTAARLLDSLPDAAGHVQEALNLQVLLGQALAATKGYGAREVSEAFARARDLARQVGGTPQLLSVLFGLWTSIAGQGVLDVAHDLAEELLAVAERAGLPSETVWGHLASGANRYTVGEHARAREHFARVLALYREAERPAGPSDPGVMALSYACVNSWIQGQVGESREHARAALELADRLRNPFAVAWAGFFTTALDVFRREPAPALADTERLIALCREHEFPLFVALLTLVHGAALSEAGRHDEGVTDLRQGLGLWLATGQRVSHRLYLAWLAEALARTGALDDAAATVEEALGLAPDERLFEPELHRVRAEILARQDAGPERIEASFRAAVELARAQEAHSYELRAATSWARWLQAAGRRGEAREMLGPVCGWFPADVDMVDLRDARALLQGLSR
ncbi:MAG TPA: AAA family ATPase [Candidatus Binatia bacterium]|nr:AAA family ATPase [Candidatus Binatia bacterium]